ncbi:MAG: hypothetical protein KKD44_02980 [Proteobacteria bacterium]|nr:hypothetical protein [Pseudomonadota bacterium]
MDLDETQIPGGVYLCQISDSISCGACCGLYNVADPSHENLSALLENRTDLFDQTPRDFDSLSAFALTIENQENQERPYPEFHHCPYLGLVGNNRNRPGCLLHPLGKNNKNTDHRGLSHWGGFACASYFCPTCHELPARYKKILRACVDNWYIFGLALTENRCLGTYFGMIEKLLGHELVFEEVQNNTVFQESVNRFLNLKTTWPYRKKPFNRMGNYFFKDDLYPRETIDYEQLGCTIPPCDPILQSLGTWCRDMTELNHAIQNIDDMIHDAANTLD